jgi:hypothetical protein
VKSQDTVCKRVSYTLRLGDEGTRSSVLDVVPVQWIVSPVVYVAVEWPTLHVGVAALVSHLA